MADETNQNQAGEVAPTTDQPVATDLPTANKPDSKATAVPPKREKPPAKAAAGEKPAATADGEEKPAAKAAAAKKEKAPAVEDKPFVEFIQQHYLPAVQTAITQQGVADLQLSFAKQKVPISGFESAEDCYQLVGSWQNGLRQFNLYFPDEDIQGKKDSLVMKVKNLAH